MPEALVIVEDLHKSFLHMGRRLDVLRGIDLNIHAGQILAIVGASGAGKSTLLHCIGTLDLPSTGRIRLGGEELTTMSSSRLAAVRNRSIGFVFQFHHLLPEFNALENVMLPGMIQGRPRKELERRAQALLEEVRYDEDGNPVTSNLADYGMISAAELPSFEVVHMETPTFLNPLGAKGIGESGTIGSTPAVQSAVVDAVSHLGVRHIDMPATAEKVWRAIRDAG